MVFAGEPYLNVLKYIQIFKWGFDVRILTVPYARKKIHQMSLIYGFTICSNVYRSKSRLNDYSSTAKA